MMFPEKKDEELVGIILDNEQEADKAFKEIYSRYNKKIYKLICNSIYNLDDCMDIFQQIFLIYPFSFEAEFF